MESAYKCGYILVEINNELTTKIDKKLQKLIYSALRRLEQI